jgi:inositol 1,4,5-triphosphate receptor type 1
MCLHEVQVYLDREGASDLVAELVMKSSLSPNVFMEAIQLGISLLEGGNPVIQRSLFTKLQSAETSAIFFKVFHDKVRESQAEIRSTMSVNTTETASAGNNKLQDHSHEMKDHFPYNREAGGTAGSSNSGPILESDLQFNSSGRMVLGSRAYSPVQCRRFANYLFGRLRRIGLQHHRDEPRLRRNFVAGRDTRYPIR